jgi:Fe2+ transport system protein FeoA
MHDKQVIKLAEAPPGRPLGIVDVQGGEAVRRRLFALGFHKGDLIEINSRGIFRGPLLVRNLTSDTSIALGRGIASKIMVNLVSDEH